MYQNINYNREWRNASLFKFRFSGWTVHKEVFNLHKHTLLLPYISSERFLRRSAFNLSKLCLFEIQPRFAHYHSTRSLKNVAYLQLAKENEPIERARQANTDALTRITRRKIRGEVNGNSLFKLLLVERPIVNFRIPYSSGFASGAKWIYEYERAIHYGHV